MAYRAADAAVAQMGIAWEIAKEAKGYASQTRRVAIEIDKGRVEVFTELLNLAYYRLLKQPEEG